MIIKVLYDFLCIATFPWGKNGHLGAGWGHEFHSAKNFLLIVPEKLELSEEEGDDQNDDLIAKD